MGTGVTPRPTRSPDAGFSLIELVIVITVLSILTISVGLSVSFGRPDRQASDDALRFQAYFSRLQANAIYSQKPQGITIQTTGWQVAQYNTVTRVWKIDGPEIRWRGAADFRKTGTTGFAGTARSPDVIFLPDGRSTAFEIRFRYKKTISYCKNNGWTGVICAPS